MSGPVVLGLDIGGSSVKYLVAPADASLSMPPTATAYGRVPTPKIDPVLGIVAIVHDLCRDSSLAHLVLSVPGLVDEVNGVVVRSTNIPALDGCNLGAELSAALGIPVSVINDGHAAAVAEATWGAGSGVEDVFVLALGTGIAGAHVVNGAVESGAHGSAGELGHITVDPAGKRCSCGRVGCLETIIGAPALSAAWKEAGRSGGPEKLMSAYTAADAVAMRIVQDAASALADALLTLCALVDPGCIVIGGGLAQDPHHFVTLAREYVGKRATFHQVPPIVPATLGTWAGANGTVLYGLRATKQLA